MNFDPLSVFPPEQPAFPQPVPARSVAPEGPTHAPAEGPRPSAPVEQLRRSIIDSASRQSTMSQLAKMKPRATSVRRMLMKTGNGDVAKLKDNRQNLVDRVKAHRGPVIILGNDGLPAYVFERDEATGHWQGFSGINGELLAPGQSEPDKLLAQMMGPPQSLRFSAYGFVSWVPASGAGASQSPSASPSPPSSPRPDEEWRHSFAGPDQWSLSARHPGLVSPSRSSLVSALSSTLPQSRRASVHALDSEEPDERPVSPLSPIMLAQQPNNSSAQDRS